MVFCRQDIAGLIMIVISSLSLVAIQTHHTSTGIETAPTASPLAAVNGPQRTVVILVKFPDRENSSTPVQISNTMLSLNDYYNENSFGTTSFLADITPTASPWYLMPNSMGFYGADTVSANNQLVDDSLRAAYNAGVSIPNYKFAIIVHAGNDEAISRVSSDIHSYTIPGFVFNPSPLISHRIPTSVVAESDPMGVYAHESGHLIDLPDLYDVTGQIDPTNNFLGYWELMALGEWNPNTGNLLIQPGTYPSHMSAWSKIQLGWLASSRLATVQAGESANITVQNLELPTAGIQSVKIPIAFNSDGSLTYYLAEMRAKLGTYDQHLPFPSTYPGAGLLIYHVNESIPGGRGSVRLIDAHPGGNLNDAPFGPCTTPCISNNTFWDQTNYVKIIVTTTTSTSYTITVDRTDAPPLLLQVNTPSAGVLISVDGVNWTSDGSKELRLSVRYGPHTIFVQPRIPIAIGSTTIQVGLTNAFTVWDDGSTANPRGISVVKDTVLTAIYRVTIEPSFATAATAAIILGIVTLAIIIHRRKNRRVGQATIQEAASPTPAHPQPSPGEEDKSLPRDNVLPRDSVKDKEEAKGS